MTGYSAIAPLYQKRQHHLTETSQACHPWGGGFGGNSRLTMPGDNYSG